MSDYLNIVNIYIEVNIDQIEIYMLYVYLFEFLENEFSVFYLQVDRILQNIIYFQNVFLVKQYCMWYYLFLVNLCVVEKFFLMFLRMFNFFVFCFYQLIKVFFLSSGSLILNDVNIGYMFFFNLWLYKIGNGVLIINDQ